jgi:uncharacterized membrane protein
MTPFLTACAVFLHSLATVVLIGHYLLLVMIYLPALTQHGFDGTTGKVLSEISKRSRSWMYASLVTFMVTGIYLMLVDPNYLGIGNFGNPWGILMLVKHLIIIGMLILGFWFNAMLRVGPQMASDLKAAQGFRGFRLYANLMAISGVLVLLLTAIAQFE